MKFGITSAAVSIALLAAAPAVSIAEAPHAHAASTTVTVKETEFHFALSRTSVPRGTVVFKLKNAGHLAHDFKINGKKSKLLQPGRSTTLTVTFGKAGKYPYTCTVPGHASAGMKGKLTVR